MLLGCFWDRFGMLLGSFWDGFRVELGSVRDSLEVFGHALGMFCACFGMVLI